jgi:uncharacterized protein (TIGR02147 family)
MNDGTHIFPNLFEYDNYRLFLKDAFVVLKARDKKMSLRYFARIAGFNAHTFLGLVIEDKCNMSAESADKISKAFKFKAEETHFANISKDFSFK